MKQSRQQRATDARQMRNLYKSIEDAPSAREIARATGLTRAVVTRALNGETKAPRTEVITVISSHINSRSMAAGSIAVGVPLAIRLARDVMRLLVDLVGRDRAVAIATDAADGRSHSRLIELDDMLSIITSGARDDSEEWQAALSWYARSLTQSPEEARRDFLSLAMRLLGASEPDADGVRTSHPFWLDRPTEGKPK